MSKIIVGFSRPSSFKIGAELISMWMNRPYSHVYVRFISPKLGDVVFHAAHGMVHFMTLDNFTKSNTVVKEYAVDSGDITEVLKFCIGLAGTGYGYSELFKILLVDSLTYLNIHPETYNGKGYICSELAGQVLKMAVGAQYNKPMHLLKPSDIDTFLEDYCGKA